MCILWSLWALKAVVLLLRDQAFQKMERSCRKLAKTKTNLKILKKYSFLKTSLFINLIQYIVGSTISDVREPRSCLGRVFNSKLGRIGKWMAYMQSLLELKTPPKFRPVSKHYFHVLLLCKYQLPVKQNKSQLYSNELKYNGVFK
jgi:hypothetical protein